MRRSVGTAMLWGAFGVTLFGIFLPLRCIDAGVRKACALRSPRPK
jgi:hypothetical protein